MFNLFQDLLLSNSDKKPPSNETLSRNLRKVIFLFSPFPFFLVNLRDDDYCIAVSVVYFAIHFFLDIVIGSIGNQIQWLMIIYAFDNHRIIVISVQDYNGLAKLDNHIR